MRLILSLTLLTFLGRETLAATVRKTLTIGNAELNPDGFSRT